MDATPVGRIECVGKQVGCDAPLTSADQSDLQPLVVTDYPDLTPMWTHEVPGDSRFASALLIDSDGTWTGECAKQAEGDLCQVDEVLVFEGTGAAPRRFPFTATTVQENEGKLSFWWVSSDQHPHIDRLNTNGDVLWRQTGTLGPDGWQLQGVGLPDYKLAAVMYNQHDPSDQQQLWVLDSQGNFASRVGIGPLSQFEKLLADTKGNLSLVASSQDGDLIMSKLGVSGVFSGVSLQREEYTMLIPYFAALDLDGTLYVVSRMGGRMPADQHTILCQTDFSATHCFRLPADLDGDKSLSPPIDAFVAAESGVVYIRTGNTVSRYELPR